jgi:adenosylcobyric acid synthase
MIMVSGTSSSAGKSVFVAALCRVISKMGYRVAPFKAQNMSLNSYVTKDGKEIAIAQAFQAQAAGIEPDVRMNPILLKPKGNGISQLIVMGEAVKDVKATRYYQEINGLMKVVQETYYDLLGDFDVVVIEGAGGIAEINLYDRDIANIGMARIAKPDIYIISDIDRGGVFASLYGTFALLPQDVRDLVKGFIINRLRGYESLLKTGIEQLEELTGIRVLGVIPYLNHRMPSEDSLSLEEWHDDGVIGVVRLPRISNFTDFEPLRFAGVRIVNLKDNLDGLEILILPGTKETISDLKALKRWGMDEKIKRFARDKPVIGICGGYQILGKEIEDRGVEYRGNQETIRVKGLGLLDAYTRFDEYRKTTVRVERTVTGEAAIIDGIVGEKVSGYEIHMGKTASSNPIFEDDGCASEDGLVWGTYLHGLFHNPNVQRAFADHLGLKYVRQEDPIDIFTSVVMRKVDVPFILRNAGLEVSF